MVVAASSAQAHTTIAADNAAINVSVFSAPKALISAPAPITNRATIQLVQKKISASKAKKIARSRVKKGEVVDVSLHKNTYKVRLIAKNGRVVDVLIDASTGRVK